MQFVISRPQINTDGLNCDPNDAIQAVVTGKNRQHLLQCLLCLHIHFRVLISQARHKASKHLCNTLPTLLANSSIWIKQQYCLHLTNSFCATMNRNALTNVVNFQKCTTQKLFSATKQKYNIDNKRPNLTSLSSLFMNSDVPTKIHVGRTFTGTQEQYGRMPLPMANNTSGSWTEFTGCKSIALTTELRLLLMTSVIK